MKAENIKKKKDFLKKTHASYFLFKNKISIIQQKKKLPFLKNKIAIIWHKEENKKMMTNIR